MNIMIFGATGAVGSRTVGEAARRHHQVTAVSRQTVPEARRIRGAHYRQLDLYAPAALAGFLAGQDAVISAIRPPEGHEADLPVLSERLLDAAAAADIPIVFTGGAASLKLSAHSETTVLTEPGFLPQSVIPIARACQAQYDRIRRASYDQWSYLAPPAELLPGVRRGTYRIGYDHLVRDNDGRSWISMEDLAIALLDEAETGRHRGQRFTVGY
ncbi:MAG: NAD(P)H-binding protein [Alphaproteobacteria bacterium]|nr:NAD(P)H-binding protein [Alphaproteobacteria bacterium]